MKAIVCERNGPAENLRLAEVEKPVPKDNEILVKVRAGTVTRGDVRLRSTGPLASLLIRIMGFGKKTITGTELAGEVEEAGRDVTRFKTGDQVYGTTTALRYGANAEYVCLPEEWKMGAVAMKPKTMSFEEAAAVPIGGMTALQICTKADIRQGQRVLVYGASGSVGTYAVQLAKYWGAEVTGVCSTANLDMVRSIGADRVIDYTKQDFTGSGRAYDVVFDAVGKVARSALKSLTVEGGTVLSVKTMTSEKSEYLDALREIIEAGKLRAVIDRCYPLKQTDEAHRYVEKGRKKGNVVITME